MACKRRTKECGTPKKRVGDAKPPPIKSPRTPSTPSHARSQARRTGGHALGAWYTARSMIPGNGVCRVRGRSFAEVRSADSTYGGSTSGGAGEGVSIIRLVSIPILSVSSPTAAKGVSCSRHESSMPESSSRRGLLVDVELVLWVGKCGSLLPRQKTNQRPRQHR